MIMSHLACQDVPISRRTWETTLDAYRGLWRAEIIRADAPAIERSLGLVLVGPAVGRAARPAAGPTTLFTLASAGLDLAHAGSLVVMGLLEAATFVSAYAVSNALANGPAHGLPFLLLASVALAVVFLFESRRCSTTALTP